MSIYLMEKIIIKNWWKFFVDSEDEIRKNHLMSRSIVPKYFALLVYFYAIYILSRWNQRFEVADWSYRANIAVWIYRARIADWSYRARIVDWSYRANIAVWIYRARIADWSYRANIAVWIYRARIADWSCRARIADWSYRANIAGSGFNPWIPQLNSPGRTDSSGIIIGEAKIRFGFIILSFCKCGGWNQTDSW